MVITSRTAVDAFDRLDGFGGKINHVLCVVDFVVVVWVLFAFFALAYSHFVACRRDDRIRVFARDFEDEIIAKANSEKAQKQKAEDALIELAHEAIALSMSEETEPHGGEIASQKQTPTKKYRIGTIAVGLALLAVSLLKKRQNGE